MRFSLTKIFLLMLLNCYGKMGKLIGLVVQKSLGLSYQQGLQAILETYSLGCG